MTVGIEKCKHPNDNNRKYTLHQAPKSEYTWNLMKLQHTLQLKMFPNAENVSYMALLSILLSKFFMKTLPTPDLRSDGSR
jgi:hypothetical protein